MYRYFHDTDFKRCTPSCSIDDMNSAVVESLDYARALYGLPIVLTSAYRTVEYELSQGRKGTSSHCKGLAVDIRCTDEFKRIRLVTALLRAGFRRLGIADTYIHVDCDEDKPKCLWLY